MTPSTPVFRSLIPISQKIENIRIETLSPDSVRHNIEEILGVADDVQGEYWSEKNFLSDLPEKWTLSFSAWTGKKLAGYAILSRRTTTRVHLHHFMVCSAQRGHGLGSKMLLEVLDRARDAGAVCVSLKVGEDNERAIAFYQRAGFRMDGRDCEYLSFVRPV